MITSRNDYILRIIDEVTRILARIIFKRRAGADQEALETVIEGFQRLFSLQADQIFQLTPEHHFVMLTLDEPPDIARDKVLLYAALSAEAGRIYKKLGNAQMAHATFTNALRFCLRSREFVSDIAPPELAPKPDELIAELGGPESLDAETKSLLTEAP